MSKFQQALRTLRLMFSPYKPIKRPTFPTDKELIARQLAQRDLIGDRPITPLIEPQPDFGERIGPREVGRAEPKRVDFEDLPV